MQVCDPTRVIFSLDLWLCKPTMRLMVVFQWGHLVGNYGFSEGQGQCLQRR